VTAASYRSSIGLHRGELATPALLLDLDALRANIRTMADWAEGRVGIRSHTKIHKCVEIARLQLEAGACGLTVATIWEALAMTGADPGSVLIANEILDPRKLDLLAVAAREREMILAVDSVEGAEASSAAARRAGSEIGVLVDIDVGMGRAGVRSAEDAVRVAAAVDGLPGIALRGAMGYEGHVVTEPDRAERARKANAAMDLLAQRIDEIEARGYAIEIVSGGGTNTYDMTGVHPRVTELQTGSYAVMDAWFATLTPAFRPAITVLAQCVSRMAGTAVLDCGTKTITVDYFQPQLPPRHGTIREVHEEHTLIDVGDSDGPRPGERIELVIGYCGGTINLHDAYHVMEGEQVAAVWPIRARGAGQGPA
jgi:D-serine deaminase-like pyridoxal phosphate-dependent protein